MSVVSNETTFVCYFPTHYLLSGEETPALQTGRSSSSVSLCKSRLRMIFSVWIFFFLVPFSRLVSSLCDCQLSDSQLPFFSLLLYIIRQGSEKVNLPTSRKDIP